MYKVDHKDVFEGNGVMKEGDYEVIVNKAGEMVTPGGTVYFSVDLIVRNDIEQEYKNKHVFHAIWKTKATGEYNFTNFNTMCKALKIAEGTAFKDFDELAAGITGKVATVTIKNEEYNNKVSEKVKGWKESKYQACNHVFKEKAKGEFPINNGNAEDDDLPF